MKFSDQVVFCLLTAGRKTQLFCHTLTQPGKGLLEVPSKLAGRGGTTGKVTLISHDESSDSTPNPRCYDPKKELRENRWYPDSTCRVYIGAIKTLTVFTHFLLGLIVFQFMPGCSNVAECTPRSICPYWPPGVLQASCPNWPP